MGENSGISWTTHTFNAYEGCEKVSPGCKHCYAENRNNRYHAGAHWGPAATTPRLLRSPAYWNQPRKWNKAALAAGERHRVFSASLSDVFEDHSMVGEARARLFRTVEECPALDWLLLTKRPENIMRLVHESWRGAFPANVWMGTTAEDEAYLMSRLPHLAAVPARVRFLSVEPQLEYVDVTPALDAGINWVITGGESGPKARPYHAEWATAIVRQCEAWGVAPFVKQMGSNAHRGRERMKLADRAGADPTEWPEDLRVQRFPEPPPVTVAA